MKKKIIILGAGLSGLTTAYLLKKAGLDFCVLEARERIGGRIKTLYSKNKASVEMGATWLGKKHKNLLKLLEELGLQIFPQVLGDYAVYEPTSLSPPQIVRLPPNNDPSYRIVGGSSALLQSLSQSLQPEDVLCSQVVEELNFTNTGVSVKTQSGVFESEIVISTLPPCLFNKSMKVSPALPVDFRETAERTHTWMGDSIKFAFTFPEAFWQEGQSSGTLMSNVGPVPEMYDHSNLENTKHALKGFLNGSFYGLSQKERRDKILQQLEKYYGKKVHSYSGYEDAVWRSEPYTFTEYENYVLPHQNNGHPLFRKSYQSNKLYFAGAETAASYPGYMDGAVQAAFRVFEDLRKAVEV